MVWKCSLKQQLWVGKIWWYEPYSMQSVTQTTVSQFSGTQMFEERLSRSNGWMLLTLWQAGGKVSLISKLLSSRHADCDTNASIYMLPRFHKESTYVDYPQQPVSYCVSAKQTLMYLDTSQLDYRLCVGCSWTGGTGLFIKRLDLIGFWSLQAGSTHWTTCFTSRHLSVLFCNLRQLVS